MKHIKQFVVGIAAGIVLFGLFESLLGLAGLALLVASIVYWTVHTDKKVGKIS